MTSTAVMSTSASILLILREWRDRDERLVPARSLPVRKQLVVMESVPLAQLGGLRWAGRSCLTRG
jgi:hypothetical protein